MNHNISTLVQEKTVLLHKKLNEQKPENPPVQIEPSEGNYSITNIPPSGLTLSSPGTYVLSQDVEWTPDFIFVTAITITASGITLDLNEKTITAKGDLKDFCVGIKVTHGNYPVYDTKIEHGTLSEFGYCGVSAVKAYNLTIEKVTVEKLSYSTFDVLPSGFFLHQCNSFNINYCHVQECSVTAMLGAGFLIMNSVQGALYDCHVHNFTNKDGVAAGFTYNGCSYINTSSCHVNTLQTLYGGNPDSTIGHTCIGFMPTDSTHLQFYNCKAGTILGCCDDCHGMSLFTVNTVTVQGFQALGVHDGLGPQKTGAKATGLEVYGDNINISDCLVQDITAIVPQDLQSTGFSACGTLITFNNCRAKNVQVLNDDPQPKPDTQYGYGTGFGWAPDPRPQFVKPAAYVTYENCIAEDCQLGYDTWNHQNSTWKDVTYSGTGIEHLIEPNGTERIYKMNFCSELPNSNALSPSKDFPIYNCVFNNTYPGW